MQQKRINLELNKTGILQALKELAGSNPQNYKDTEKIIRKHRSVEKEVISKSFFLTSFEKIKSE
jgi:fructose-bisphosphate aldolase class 1